MTYLIMGECTQNLEFLIENRAELTVFHLSLLQATEELRGRVGKLQTMYNSGIKTLDDLAGELDGNSSSTFANMNLEVSKHSSALEDVSSSTLELGET